MRNVAGMAIKISHSGSRNRVVNAPIQNEDELFGSDGREIGDFEIVHHLKEIFASVAGEIVPEGREGRVAFHTGKRSLG
jgi:hypothetical protein